MDPDVQLRRLADDEGGLLRELRLAALADSPEAFGESFAEASARGEAWWAKLIDSLTGTGPHVAFIAERDEHSVGMIFGIVDSEDAAVGRIGGLWVAPQARHHGIGRRLLSAVSQWARAAGRSELALWAPEAATGARALYAAAGFAATGLRREAREGMWILELRRPLA